MFQKLPQISSLHAEWAKSAQRFLERLWNLQTLKLGLQSDYQAGLQDLVDNLYDPKKKLTYATAKINQLPDVRDLLPDTDAEYTLRDKLSDQGLIRIIQTRSGAKVTITPEGLSLLDLLNSARVRGDFVYVDPQKLATNLSYLITIYEEKLSVNLARVELSQQQDLSLQEVGLLLFFLINGSIGEDHACRNIDDRTSQAIEDIVRSFVGTIETKRHELHWRGWFLTEANRKLGGPIVNKEPIYYLKDDSVYTVENAVIHRVTRDTQSYGSFLIGWQRMLNTYSKKRQLLDRHHISFYSKARTDSFLHMVSNAAKRAGLQVEGS